MERSSKFVAKATAGRHGAGGRHLSAGSWASLRLSTPMSPIVFGPKVKDTI